MKKDRIAVVMAAGKSDAMNSKKTKLVHKLYGKELVTRVVETAEKPVSYTHLYCLLQKLYI